mgnify:CR=1 FL=1
MFLSVFAENSMKKSNAVSQKIIEILDAAVGQSVLIFLEINLESVLEAPNTHGIDKIDVLFPEYKDVRPGAPELLTTDQGWIAKVLSKVHKSPISRIRTRQADIRNIEKLRAQGYVKGKEKKYIGNFSLIHRTTDPQTVYVKSKIDRGITASA